MDIANSKQLEIKIDNRKNSFILHLNSNTTGMLKAPIEGSMDRRIPESIDASVKLKMFDKKGQLIYADSTSISGLEMVGEYHELQGLLK